MKNYRHTLRRQAALEASLGSRHDIQQDSEVSAFSGSQPDLRLFKLNSQPPFDIPVYLQRVTKLSYHMGCPRYREADLVRQPLPNAYFITFLESRWWLEVRFVADRDNVEANAYFLEVVGSCLGCPGVVSLVS